jgi:hypothetical protein
VCIELVCYLSGGGPCRAGGTTRLPKLADILAEFLPSRGPVRFDAVAEFGHVALQVEFALFQPRDIQFSTRCSALELAVDVLIIVTDDSAFVSTIPSLI